MRSSFVARLGQTAFLAAMVLFTSRVHAQALLRYAFNESNTSNTDARDLGVSPAANGVLSASAARVGSTPGAFSCGAVDLTLNGSNHNYVATGTDVQKLDGLTEMTLTCWVNLRGAPNVNDRLLSKRPPSFPVPPAETGGWDLRIDEPAAGQPPTAANFKLRFGIFRSQGSYTLEQSSASPSINANQQWVFLAVTYDAAKNQRFYIGGETTAVYQIGLITGFSYSLGDNTTEFRVGSTPAEPSTDRTPPAWIDDVRVYGTALTLNQLDQTRQDNLRIMNLGQVPGFHGLGDLPGGSCTSYGYDVSADGSVVAGSSSGSSGTTAYRWENGVMTPLGDLDGGTYSSIAQRISADGTVVVGQSNSASGWEAFRWEAGFMSPLGDLPPASFGSGALGTSGDGSIVVGYGTIRTNNEVEGFRWEAGVMTGIGWMDGGVPQSVAYDISTDGSVIVGITGSAAGNQAFRLVNGAMTGLGDLPGGDFESRAQGVSSDGSVVVGYGKSASGTEAFHWKAGVMQGLGDLPDGSFYSEAWAVSADGELVVGWSSGANNYATAFIWCANRGMLELKGVLANEYGLDLTGWLLFYAYGISDDGSTIVGYGRNPSGRSEAWIARLPASGRNADFDLDRDVDEQDFAIFTACATGPEVGYDPVSLPTDCTVSSDLRGLIPPDLDGDGDVDATDFGILQACLSGSGLPPSADCGG